MHSIVSNFTFKFLSHLKAASKSICSLLSEQNFKKLIQQKENDLVSESLPLNKIIGLIFK